MGTRGTKPTRRWLVPLSVPLWARSVRYANQNPKLLIKCEWKCFLALDDVPISFGNAFMAAGHQFDLPYSVELWDEHDKHVEELIALIGDYWVARAANEEAVKGRPERIETLRQKTRLLADSRRKNRPTPPPLATGTNTSLREAHEVSSDDCTGGILDRLISSVIGLAENSRVSVVRLPVVELCDSWIIGVERGSDRA
jgi:hypothetical protein